MLQPEVSFPSNSSSMLQQERFFSLRSWASLCFRAPHNLTSVCLQGLFSGHSCPKLNTKSTDLLMLRFPWLSSNWPLCWDAPPDSSLTNISLHENFPCPWFWWWSHLCCPTALHDHLRCYMWLSGTYCQESSIFCILAQMGNNHISLSPSPGLGIDK